MRPVVLLALFTLLVSERTAHAENQIWTATFVQARPGPTGVTGWLDLHARRRPDGMLGIVRPAVGYTFSKLFAAHVGYAYVPTITDAGGNRREQRSWQQVIVSPAIDAIKSQLRLRLEQRFGSGDDIGHRVRVLGRIQWQPSPDLAVQLVGWDELFIGLNDTDWTAKSGYDQNRLFVGLGTDTAVRGLRVEAGYVSVVLANDAPLVHAIAINVSATLVP